MPSPKQALSKILFPLLLALIIGALAGVGAVFFRRLIEVGIALFWPGQGDFLQQYVQAPWIMRFGMPVLAGLCLGPLLHYVAPEIRGPGVPEVMASLAMRDGIIRHRVTMAKSFATATFIAAGCSVGREGPIVQIGSSIGSSLTQLFRLGPDHRKLAVACGAAAGIAATFQAPMAGTLFVVEILLFDLEVASLSNIVIAAVTGTLVSRNFWNEGALFQAPHFSLSLPSELLLYLMLGIAAGLVSLLLMAAIFGLNKWLDSLRVPGWLTPTLGGVAIGITGLFFPQALGVGYDTINQTLQGNIVMTSALLLLAAKLLATSACVGSGMSGGIFAPSLFLGAMLGAVWGNIAQLFWPGTPLLPAHFSLVGMGAMVSGTTLAPITAIFTIFELSYNYEIILPLMVACIPSIIIVRLIHGYSIYETRLLVQGIRIIRGHDANRLRAIKVRDYICTDLKSFQEQTPLSQIMDEVVTNPFPHFVVTNKRDELQGVLTLRDVRALLAEPDPPDHNITAADLMTRNVATVREDQNLEDAFHLFSNHHFSFLPVMSAAHPGQAVGCLKKDDLITAYNQHILSEQCKPGSHFICTFPSKK